MGPPSSRSRPTPTPNGESSNEHDSSEHDSNVDTDSAPERLDRTEAVSKALHRAQVYALLARGLERPDSDDFAAAIEDDAFTTKLPAFAEQIDPVICERATAVCAQFTDRRTLKPRWVSLFGVEEGITVSPYEVTYIPGPLMTNIRKIADLRGFYEAFGLSIAPGKNDRADHIGFQLELLSHLCRQEAYLRTQGDREGVEIVVDAQRSFLEDHLGRWYWRFADEVTARDDGFYAALAELLAALVETDVERFGLEPQWVPDDPAVTEWNENIFGDSGRDCGGCGMGDGEDAFAGVDGTGPPEPHQTPGRQPDRDQ